ncbi:MAG: transglutaminase domain-containing protein [Puniceicoccaceae bacterium]
MTGSVTYQIEHRTRYGYGGEVNFGSHRLYLYPQAEPNQVVRRFELRTVPESRQRWVRDFDGNFLVICNFGLQEARQLLFEVEMVVERPEVNPFDFLLDTEAVRMPVKYADEQFRWLEPYCRSSCEDEEPVNLFLAETGLGNGNGEETVDFLLKINRAIFERFEYQRRDDEGIQSVAETVAGRVGSCRDFAVCLMAVARHLGLAARFVSGYVYVEAGESELGNRALGAMHAWVELYLPGAGWKGFDPTNGILVNHSFIATGVSGDPMLVQPTQGRYYSDAKVDAVLETDLMIQTC